MRLLDMDGTHARLLDIMVDVDAFCREHGIRYSLAFGTLLGGVRHKGFIPWDDDADIYMPRADFERFVSSFNAESGSPFHCLYNSRAKDEFFALGFAKVHDPRTSKFVGDRKSIFRYGVSLDIFPLDPVPDDAEECHEFMHRMLHLHRRLYFRHKRFFHGSPLTMIESRLHSLDWWWNKCQTEARTYDNANTGKIALFLGASTYLTILDKNIFDSMADLDFEGHKFAAFSDTDAYLTHVYGPDYMTPPPVDRRGGHGVTIYELD